MKPAAEKLSDGTRCSETSSTIFAPAPIFTTPSVTNFPVMSLRRNEPWADEPITNRVFGAMQKPAVPAAGTPSVATASGPAMAFAASCSSLSTPFQMRTSS